jgi:hypothetical protein
MEIPLLDEWLPLRSVDPDDARLDDEAIEDRERFEESDMERDWR